MCKWIEKRNDWKKRKEKWTWWRVHTFKREEVPYTPTAFQRTPREVKKIINRDRIIKNFFKYLACGLCMFISCNLIGYYLDPTALTTILQVIAGVFSYFIILILIRDELTNKLITIVLNKLLRKEVKQQWKN